MFRDRKGFLWIGTQGGLNRFDGYTFTVFNHDVQDSTSLQNNYVQAIYEDRNGVLWVGTRGGLHSFNRANGTFTRYLNNASDSRSISDNVITSICEGTSGQLWIGTDNGLNRFDQANRIFQRFLYNEGNSRGIGNNQINTLWAEREKIWIGSAAGLEYYSQKTNEFHRVDDQSGKPLISEPVTCLFGDSKGFLWAGTRNGVRRLRISSASMEIFRSDFYDQKTISDNYITSIDEDVSGTLWIGTNRGVNAFNRTNGTFMRFLNDPANPSSLSLNRVASIQAEPSGTVWIGTLGGGLNKIDRNKDQFGHIRQIPGSSPGLTNNLVWSMCEDHEGFLWIGTDEGLNKLNRKTGRVVQYRNDPRSPRSLSNNCVYAILETRDHELWIGTEHGLQMFNRATDDFTRVPESPASSFAQDVDVIFALLEDRDGYIWIGTSGAGLLRYERRTKSFKRYSTPGQTVATLYEDHSGILWVGMWSDGLLRLNRDIGQYTSYVADPNNPASISHNDVRAIRETFESGQPVLWISTLIGFNKFNPATGEFKRFYEKDGLPSDLICGALADRFGQIWISTLNGMARFDIKTESIRTFDGSDGLQSIEFSSGSYYQSKNGEMFFGGVNGLNAFYPEKIKDNPFVAPIVITAFKVFEKQVPGTFDLSDGSAVYLTHKENFFSFEFAALRLSNPRKSRYAYKLEGFDMDWVNAGARRFANYTDVKPGEYVFRVRSANPDGSWNQTGTSVRVFINPPAWRTSWAYALYTVLILLAIFSMRRYEMNRIRLKNALELETIEAVKLKEVDRLKSRFFANISHEFRTPLTLILGEVNSVLASDIDSKNKGKLQVAIRNAKRLLALINQLLDLSKIEAGSMELKSEPHELISFLKNVVFSFESLAAQKKIAIRFVAESDTAIAKYDVDKMEKVFYNLLSNAVKFTSDGGCITLQVKKPDFESGVIEVVLTDTGVGIPADQQAHIFDRFYQVDGSQTREQEGTGIGLALVKELIALHGGTISVKSNEGLGTEFTLQLRIDRRDQLNERHDRVPERLVFDEESSLVGEAIFRDPDRSGKIVLIVEDNSDVRRYLREQLDNLYRVVEAPNGLDGFSLAQEKIPDLIITDAMMPRLDGYQFTRKIRLDEKTSHVPIIMLTAKAGLDDKLEGLEKGVDIYLTKPFSARELVVQVKALIAQREGLRRRFSMTTMIKPSEISASSVDKAFLAKTIVCIEAHFEDDDFGVEQLAAGLNMSVSQLNRKLNALVNQAGGELIRSMRLQRAADLLKQKAGTVAEIAYRLGFNDQAYFSRAFKKQFGCTPSEFKKV